MKQDHIESAICAVLILVFSYAALCKLLDLRLFVAELDTHPLLRNFSRTLSWSLPASELALCVLLILPGTRIAGLYGSAALLIIFITYLSVMLLKGDHLPCSCGGIINGLNWKGHLFLNISLLSLAIGGIISHARVTGYWERAVHRKPPS